MNLLVQNHNHYTTDKAIIFSGAGERNRGYALLMKDNKQKKQRCKGLPLFHFFLCHMVELVCVCVCVCVCVYVHSCMHVYVCVCMC